MKVPRLFSEVPLGKKHKKIETMSLFFSILHMLCGIQIFMFLISLPIIPEAEFWLFELEDDPEVDPELLKNHPVNELEPLCCL